MLWWACWWAARWVAAAAEVGQVSRFAVPVPCAAFLAPTGAGVPGTHGCAARSGQELLRNNSLLQRVVRIEQQLHGGGEVLAD